MTLDTEILEFTTKLKFRQVEGSLPCARRTAEIMRLLITTRKHSDGSSLLDDVRQTAVILQKAKPMEVSIGNIARRIMKLIREEMAALGEAYSGDSQNTQSMLTSSSQQYVERSEEARGTPKMLHQRNLSLRNLLDYSIASQSDQENDKSKSEPNQEIRVEVTTEKKSKKTQWKGKQNVIDEVNEMFQELDNVDACICQQAVEHIHAKEVVLTLGASTTTFEFLVEARKKRDFVVVVAEAAPLCSGHKQARRLASAGIQTTVIADAAVYGMMARVNKVLVGAHAVLANGGIIGTIGTHLIALAAKQHAVPFVVLVGLQKLSPLFPHDPYMIFNDFKPASDVVDYDVQAEVFEHACCVEEQNGVNQMYVDIPNPGHDYVPPELISLMVTDGGGFTPQYVYRLLTEYYSRGDYILNKNLLDKITF
eukprot:TRINITY_DN5092_c0_g1_i4.p2 TRINITY_DN5092_c0_g1~~TRINITY_DN5092_c0_g1_i4.p2  ORF type:complete len:423 (-),score=64.03 TRINITY_DN5092_c0_g1_i4:140-1408(-)